MKQLFAMAIPILPGKTEQFNQFINTLKGARYSEFNKSRKELNVVERTFLQNTSMGDLIIVTLEGENPMKAFQEFGAKSDDFSNWFIEQVKEIHGIDLRGSIPEESMSRLVVTSQAVEEPELIL